MEEGNDDGESESGGRKDFDYLDLIHFRLFNFLKKLLFKECKQRNLRTYKIVVRNEFLFQLFKLVHECWAEKSINVIVNEKRFDG